LLPQIAKNYITKSVESQSLGFWILWCVGDATNLIGCLLTKQIITNTLLAIMYSICSVIALLQWIYYSHYYKERYKGSTKTVAGPAGGVVGGTLCCLCFAHKFTNPELYEVHGKRRLLHLSPIGLEIFGTTLGWVMAVVYVFSRMPQMYKCATTKDVEDLSVMMYICTCIGNTTQMLSMIIKHVKSLNVEYFQTNAPWIVNAGLCALQDLVIVYLISLYGKKPGAPESKEMQPLIKSDAVPKSYSTAPRTFKFPSGGYQQSIPEV